MKAELCHAFCDELVVRKVPDGLAVSTAFKREDGDSVGFYIVPVGNGLFRLEDSGMPLPPLMESGVAFDAETRANSSVESRVGNECVSTGSSRGSPYH